MFNPLKHAMHIARTLGFLECTRADNEPFMFLVGTLDKEDVAEPRTYLQVAVMAPDTNDPTGPKSLQKGRKWLLSKHMTVTEVVQTAWKAVEAFEIHELQERFKYKNACVFNSHIDVEERVKIARIVDVRS